MYSYYADIVWSIDAFLFFVSALLSLFIILYVKISELIERKRSHSLQALKRNVYELTFSQAQPDKSFYENFINKAGARQFLEVQTNRNKEEIFFNEAEQKIFKQAFLSLDKIKELKETSINGRNKWKRMEAILALGYASVDSAIEVIKKGLLSRDEDLSYFSLIALGQIKNEESAKVLLNYLKANPEYRYKTTAILETFPLENILSAGLLSKYLKDKDPSVRFWAIKIISRIRATTYSVDVRPLLKDESAEVRAEACECLGELGDKEAGNALKECLKDNFWLARKNAVIALGKIFGSESLKDVIDCVNDGSLSVIEAVKEVLTESKEEALPYMEGLLNSQDAMARSCAIEALENSGVLKAALKKAVSQPHKEREKAERLLELVIKSKVHFGLESDMVYFNEEERDSLLRIIESHDPMLADHIRKKLKGLINE